MVKYIEDIIYNINNKKVNLRRATIDDFQINNNIIRHSVNNFRVRKNQGEYGQKKFIKPWRTGTKSQQLPQPKNL